MTLQKRSFNSAQWVRNFCSTHNSCSCFVPTPIRINTVGLIRQSLNEISSLKPNFGTALRPAWHGRMSKRYLFLCPYEFSRHLVCLQTNSTSQYAAESKKQQSSRSGTYLTNTAWRAASQQQTNDETEERKKIWEGLPFLPRTKTPADRRKLLFAIVFSIWKISFNWVLLSRETACLPYP